MKKALITALLFSSITTYSSISSHCQMPCGIYHDDMVFDQIDQYVETMVKGDTVLNDSKFETVQQRNETIRWVMTKDRMSDEVAQIITTFFLQQKIKPAESDTVKRLESAHRLLFILVQIKQTADIKIVKQFYDEWEKFKLMFHIEGYECEMEKIKLENWGKTNDQAWQQQLQRQTHSHAHSHDQDHEHTSPFETPAESAGASGNSSPSSPSSVSEEVKK